MKYLEKLKYVGINKCKLGEESGVRSQKSEVRRIPALVVLGS
jgi:hypothetical protein